MDNSNWDELHQQLINSVVDIQDRARALAAADVVKRLVKEGIPENKIIVSPNKKSIVAKPANDQEYQAGKIYFDKVIQDINDDDTWAEKL